MCLQFDKFVVQMCQFWHVWKNCVVSNPSKNFVVNRWQLNFFEMFAKMSEFLKCKQYIMGKVSEANDTHIS